MIMNNRIILFAALFLLAITAASAHLPSIVIEDRNYMEKPVVVETPEISYAYYGELQMQPHRYMIDSDKDFVLYVNILAPYLNDSQPAPNIGFAVYKYNDIIAEFSNIQNWTIFYEEYGGDWYYMGPSFEMNATPGQYTVKVFGDTNTEKYVLAIGQQEKWGFIEVLHTLLVLPFVKAIFFEKYTMLIIMGSVLAAIIALTVILYEIRRKKK